MTTLVENSPSWKPNKSGGLQAATEGGSVTIFKIKQPEFQHHVSLLPKLQDHLR